jgi:hypothetical protein
MIKYNKDVDTGFNIIQQLKYQLIRIRNTKEIQEGTELY